MTPSQIADLLGFCAAFDRRTVGTADALAWHTVLGDLDFNEARQAVTEHYATNRDWIMPADIREAVRAVHRDRLERHTEAEPPIGDRCDQTYQAALLNERRAIASGQIAPQPVPTRLAIEAGTAPEQPTGRARALLASVGSAVPTIRAGITNILAVPCPMCHAKPGRTCTSTVNPRRRRSDVHPARLEDAQRAAAGQPPADREDANREIEHRRAAARAAVARLAEPVEPDDDFDPKHRTKKAAAEAEKASTTEDAQAS